MSERSSVTVVAAALLAVTVVNVINAQKQNQMIVDVSAAVRAADAKATAAQSAAETALRDIASLRLQINELENKLERIGNAPVGSKNQ